MAVDTGLFLTLGVSMSIQSGADRAPESAQRAVRWVALVVLSGLTVTGFAVSYTRLHGFMGRYGEEGWTAYASAGMVDSLALSGLLVALVFRDWWARAAFVLALGFTGFANAFVGFQYASWFGLVVGLVPILSMELAYRIALSLMLPTRGTEVEPDPGQAETTPAHEVAPGPESDQATAPAPVQLDRVAPEPDPGPDMPMVHPGPRPDPVTLKAQRVVRVAELLDQRPDLTAQQVAHELGGSLTSGKRYLREVRRTPAPVA